MLEAFQDFNSIAILGLLAPDASVTARQALLSNHLPRFSRRHGCFEGTKEGPKRFTKPSAPNEQPQNLGNAMSLQQNMTNLIVSATHLSSCRAYIGVIYKVYGTSTLSASSS